jgi:hypothetical protein
MKRHDPQPIVWTPRGYAVVGLFVAVILALFGVAR